MELKAESISKKIRGKVILDNINLTLTSGNIYGFVGRNGSGKTMFFRALSGLMKVDSGFVHLDDKILGKDFSVLPSLGMIIENTGMYPEYTGFTNLRILAGIKKNIGSDQIKETLNRVGLFPDDKRTVRKYSLGMKQRLAVAQAIMEKPDIIMLDEPTNGLDENGVQLIREIATQEKERGALILLASHSAEDIKLLSDKVIHISEGKIIDKDER